MNQFLPEGLYPQPEGYTREDLLLAMQQRKILQAAAIKCDERHNLHVALGCCKGIIPRAEAARGILGGETRDIAILSRVGRPICFTVMGFAPDGTALLSRRSAQEAALEQIFRENRPGDILPAVVTGLAPFGAFCDIGCGASGLLGLRNLCVSRLTHPGDLLRVGQRLPVLIQSLDPARRRVALTLQELLGTWEENAARFRPGQSVPGVVCGKTDYGVFIALTPNLCGLAERDDTLEPGPAGMCIHQGHPPRDAQAEADRPASAGRAAAAAAAVYKDTRAAGCVAVRKPGARKKRDGVLTFGCGKSVSISLFQRRTDAHRPLQAHTNSPQSFA